MNAKQEAREKAIQIRKKLSLKDQEIFSNLIKKNWDTIKKDFNLNKVGFYWPTQGEVSSLPIIEELIREGSRCFLPIVSTNTEVRKLTFKEYSLNTKLKANRFKIPEPKEGVEVSAEKLDLIFVPCVCVDEAGYRIGMGMGFYDITFKEISTQPQLITLAYDFQKIYSCFPEVHDIPTHGAITPTGYIDFYSRKAE